MSERPGILIVDDDVSARRTLKALLFREPYDLAFAANGKEAIAIWKVWKLRILDLFGKL